LLLRRLLLRLVPSGPRPSPEHAAASFQLVPE
jgi:hypothetical protein